MSKTEKAVSGFRKVISAGNGFIFNKVNGLLRYYNIGYRTLGNGLSRFRFPVSAETFPAVTVSHVIKSISYAKEMVSVTGPSETAKLLKL
jgi:hypothetical protein